MAIAWVRPGIAGHGWGIVGKNHVKAWQEKGGDGGNRNNCFPVLGVYTADRNSRFPVPGVYCRQE